MFTHKPCNHCSNSYYADGMTNSHIQVVAQNISVGTYSYQIEANSIDDFIFVIEKMNNSISATRAPSGGNADSSNSVNYSVSDFYSATYDNGILSVKINNKSAGCGTWAHTYCGSSNIIPSFTIYKI